MQLPEDVNHLNFSDLENSVIGIVDALNTVINEIDSNPLLRVMIPEEYRSMLGKVARIIAGADTFLHKVP